MDIEYFCINLKCRKDRRKYATKVFKQLGLLDKIQWFFTEKSLYGGKIGCFESHIACFEKSTRDIVVIFEDDISINKKLKINWNDIEKTVIKQMKKKDLFFIGCLVYPIEKSYYQKKNKIIHNASFMTTTCYAISRRCITKLLPLLKFIIKNKELRISPFVHIDACLNCLVPAKCKSGFICPKLSQRDLTDTNNKWFPDVPPAFKMLGANIILDNMEYWSRKYMARIFRHQKISNIAVCCQNEWICLNELIMRYFVLTDNKFYGRGKGIKFDNIIVARTKLKNRLFKTMRKNYHHGIYNPLRYIRNMTEVLEKEHMWKNL